MMLCLTASFGQDKVSISRDSLFNLALNVAELKVDNAYLLKKVSNQKLIIQSMGIIITETELQVEVLKEIYDINDKSGFFKKTWIWIKGVVSGAVATIGLLMII